jgi:hypothetical protein
MACTACPNKDYAQTYRFTFSGSCHREQRVTHPMVLWALLVSNFVQFSPEHRRQAWKGRLCYLVGRVTMTQFQKGQHKKLHWLVPTT